MSEVSWHPQSSSFNGTAPLLQVVAVEVHTQLELAGSTGAGGATGGVASASAVAMAANAITLAIQRVAGHGTQDLAGFVAIGRVQHLTQGLSV